MVGKKFWQSKTFWVNIVGAAGVVALAFGFPEQRLGEASAFALAAVNVILRLVTSDPIVWGE